MGPTEDSATSPKLSSSALSSLRIAEIPMPSDMINGTVIGPVVTPPASNATAIKSPGASSASPNTNTYSTISMCARVTLKSILRSAATRNSPTPNATERTRTIFGTAGTCSASTWRSGSDIVTINPRIKLRRTITPSFFVCVIHVPTFSPMGVIDISTPRVKNIIPTVSITAPRRNASRMPGSTGATVKHSTSTIAMIGSTAFNVSLSFSCNFSCNLSLILIVFKFTHSLPFSV